MVHTPCLEERVSKHGILEVREEDGRVLNFLEKPDPQVGNLQTGVLRCDH